MSRDCFEAISFSDLSLRGEATSSNYITIYFHYKYNMMIDNENILMLQPMLKSCKAGFQILISLTWRPGGRDCFSLSAFSVSVIFRVYKNLEQRTLNLTFSLFFFILTPLASFLRASSRNCLISLISRGILASGMQDRFHKFMLKR